jgi:hypothetical protein
MNRPKPIQRSSRRQKSKDKGGEEIAMVRMEKEEEERKEREEAMKAEAKAKAKERWISGCQRVMSIVHCILSSACFNCILADPTNIS